MLPEAIALVGSVAHGPEFHQTRTGETESRFTLVMPRGAATPRGEPFFTMRVVVPGQAASQCARPHLKPGQVVRVQGYLRSVTDGAREAREVLATRVWHPGLLARQPLQVAA